MELSQYHLVTILHNVMLKNIFKIVYSSLNQFFDVILCVMLGFFLMWFLCVMLGSSSFPFACVLLIACYMCFSLCAFADSVSGLVLLLSSNK